MAPVSCLEVNFLILIFSKIQIRGEEEGEKKWLVGLAVMTELNVFEVLEGQSSTLTAHIIFFCLKSVQ